MKGIIIFTILLFIKFYRLCVSPLLLSRCRYIPTCSEYSMIAIKRYGIFKGGVLGLKRVFRCNPFGKSGFDPVP
ncbi:MAG: membrane protein insertion efficiency factor YidD [Bacteroidales bacterium OttesenSCG-928-I14]|nr:membrane protein insertion efficiency factor YidD [Bacteroidales bacterium OttesenSCG-928-I14]